MSIVPPTMTDDVTSDSMRNADDQPAAGPKEDLSLLIDRTPPWLRWPPAALAISVVIGLVYWLYSVTPLSETDLWAHVAYGKDIVANGIPETEPLMPLCEGMPMPAVDWLWDVSAYGLASTLGPQGLKFLVAGPIALTLVFLAWAAYRRNWSGTWTCIALVACVWMLHKQLFIRPQLVGLTLFTAVWLIAREGRTWRALVAVGVTFVAWSNLHGSWPVGVALLGAMTIGRGLDLLRRTGTLRSLRHDKAVRRLFVMTEIAAVAVVINPDGWRIYPGVWSILSDVNVQALVEWQPLTLLMKQGQALAMVTAVLILLYRVSPRRVSFTEPLLLFALAAATLHTSRFIVWLAPLVAYYVSLHGAAWWRAWRGKRLVVAEGRGLWAIASLGFVWIAFALSPQYRALTGAERPQFDDAEAMRRVVSSETPLSALAFLRENPPNGLIYNDLAFGDSLLWFGPDGVQPFVHSHAHLTPRTVWTDYFNIARGNAAETRLNRYGAVAALLHASRGKSLAKALIESGDWKAVYKDGQAIVLARATPIGVPVEPQAKPTTDNVGA